MVELIGFYLGSAVNRAVFLLFGDAVVLVPVLNGHFQFGDIDEDLVLGPVE